MKDDWNGERSGLMDLREDTLLTSHCSRISYQRCIYKEGIWKRLQPIDRWNHGQIRILAKKYYEQLYADFAKFVLPPCFLPRSYSSQIHVLTYNLQRRHRANTACLSIPISQRFLEPHRRPWVTKDGMEITELEIRTRYVPPRNIARRSLS
jgi:hypothetical protein